MRAEILTDKWGSGVGSTCAAQELGQQVSLGCSKGQDAYVLCFMDPEVFVLFLLG